MNQGMNQDNGINELEPVSKRPPHRHKQRLMSNHIHINNMNGDSIGEPVSDMLPGVTVGVPTDMDPNLGDLHENNPMEAAGLPTIPHDQYEHNMPSDNPPPTKPANPELPINRLTDYDILDVDLEGLGNMPKQSAMQQPGIDRSMMSQGPNLENAMQDASFIGDRLNNEANDFDNWMTLKKKKIPTKQKEKFKKDNNKIVVLKKSHIIHKQNSGNVDLNARRLTNLMKKERSKRNS